LFKINMVKKKRPTLRKEIKGNLAYIYELDTNIRKLKHNLARLDDWKDEEFPYHGHCKRCGEVTKDCYASNYCEGCGEYITKRNKTIKKCLMIAAALTIAFITGASIFCGVI